MSDYLEVAKECGIATGICGGSSTRKKLESYTSRILASQQAAHEAEIAELRKEIAYAERCALAQTRHAEAALEKLSAANTACAMKDEALKFYANGAHTRLMTCLSSAEDVREVESEGWECFGDLYNGDVQYVEDGKTARDAISATSQQVAEWERKQLEPLRAQVAMLHKLLAKFSYNEYGPKRFPDEDAVLDAINNTQSIAEQFITDCEQRGAVKALEEYANHLLAKQEPVFNHMAEDIKIFAESIGATSKKAG